MTRIACLRHACGRQYRQYRQWRRALMLALMALAASTALPAAESEISLSIKPVQVGELMRNIPQGREAGRYDIAVLVANRNYHRSGVPAVDFAHNDLAAMRQYLQQAMGFRAENILVEKDATKGTFETLFGNARSPKGKLDRYVRPGVSRVFIYYVGHGAPDPETGDSYFVPVDADPDYIANSGYPVSTFYANLKQLPAKELVVVLDTCFSGRTQKGLLFKNVSPAMLKTRQTQAGIEKGAVFTSARHDQLSTWYPQKQHSLFTYYFLKGLQGEADADDNQRITLAELGRYVGGEVEYWAGRLAGKTQQPLLEGREDIVLVDSQ